MCVLTSLSGFCALAAQQTPHEAGRSHLCVLCACTQDPSSLPALTHGSDQGVIQTRMQQARRVCPLTGPSTQNPPQRPYMFSPKGKYKFRLLVNTQVLHGMDKQGCGEARSRTLLGGISRPGSQPVRASGHLCLWPLSIQIRPW